MTVYFPEDFAQDMAIACRWRIRISYGIRIETGSWNFTPVSGWIKLVI